MAFEREIGAVHLQDQPGAHDGLVLDAKRLGERVEIGFFGRVMLIATRGGDDPW